MLHSLYTLGAQKLRLIFANSKRSLWRDRVNKRDFLKSSGAILTGSMLSRFTSAEAGPQAAKASPAKTPEVRANWGGNLHYSTDKLITPSNVAEVQQAVKSTPSLKALGSRHSFNTIADSSVEQLSLKNFSAMSVDPQARTVTVGGGVTYSDLAPYLESHGFALHNLASLPHITVAGACATATHGSGIHNGNLTTAVSAMQIVTADGQLLPLSRAKDGERFLSAAVGLGALGIITSITLDIQPTFQMAQTLYENLSFDQLERNLDTIFSSGLSVSLFTDWQHNRAAQVWIKRRVEPGAKLDIPAQFYGATLATQKLHPVPGHSAESCTDQLSVPGPWYDRMPHFKIGSVPSAGAEIQSEFFVSRDQGYAAIRAVEQLRDHITPHLYITEFRTIAADNLFMSTCYQRPSLALHFTWKPELEAVMKVLPLIEAKLAPFNARPHWAKVFTLSPARLQSLYPKLPKFKALLQQYDPGGKFRNQFLKTNLYGA
jgi:xylitol oxidase